MDERCGTMEDLEMNMEFYRRKRVFITGHTGFKGAWLTKILTDAGALVTGYALEPPTNPNLFSLLDFGQQFASINGDVRDYGRLKNAFDKAKPEIVIHMAAQPLVRESYQIPRETFETNVMGSTNILECVRLSPSVRSVLNVTTDKVYKNHEWEWGYRENDVLNGRDPYSNSKSCSEMITQCYKSTFFADTHVGISTVRAGNVIGGGDFAKDRIIPDCVAAAQSNRVINVRNPNSVRPYQHVLEALFAYLMVARAQYDDPAVAGSYNIGPDEKDCVTTAELVTCFCNLWGGMKWEKTVSNGPYESSFLKLDCSRLRRRFGWTPKWGIEVSLAKTIQWAKAYFSGDNIEAVMEAQIEEFIKDERAE